MIVIKRGYSCRSTSVRRSERPALTGTHRPFAASAPGVTSRGKRLWQDFAAQLPGHAPPAVRLRYKGRADPSPPPPTPARPPASIVCPGGTSANTSRASRRRDPIQWPPGDCSYPRDDWIRPADGLPALLPHRPVRRRPHTRGIPPRPNDGTCPSLSPLAESLSHASLLRRPRAARPSPSPPASACRAPTHAS